MRHIAKGLVLISLVFGAAAVSQAGIIELRGGVGLSGSDDDDIEDQANAISGGGIEANEFTTYHADLFVNLPALPIGFGVRQEWLNVSDEGANGSDLDLKIQNLSALIDFRIIDTAFYLGPIIGIGHPSAKIDYDDATFSIDDDLDADELSYTAGLEVGAILGSFLIGAEAGYQSIKLEGSDDPQLRATLDASGVYGKAMIGLTFL